MKLSTLVLLLIIPIQYIWAQDTLSHCGPFAVPVSSDADVWSAITIFDRDSGDLNQSKKYIGELQLLMFDSASLAVVTLRVWEGIKTIRNSQGKLEISNFGKRIYQQNVTSSLIFNSISTGSTYSKYVLDDGIELNNSFNYAIEVEVAQVNHSQPAIGADTGPMLEGRGGWLVNYQFPNGIQLNELDPQFADRNWNIRAVTRDVRLSQREIPGLPGPIQLFPNPARDMINIVLPGYEASIVQIQLFNQLGEQVYFKEENLTVGQNKYEVEISNLPRGIYSCRISTNAWLETLKVIKAR